MSALHDAIRYKTEWRIKKYADDDAFAAGDAYAEEVIDGNMLLAGGIGALFDLGAGLATPTAFNAANAYIGVGDSSTAEAQSQTGLQAATNKAYAGMAATYPSRSGTTTTWQAVFGSGAANYSWNEFVVCNGSAGGTIALNRKVSAQGTKASGQTWTVSVAITLS